MRRAVAVVRDYPHPIERVWRSLTEPELVSRWRMPTDLRAEVGHRFTLRTDPYPGFDGTVHCEVLRVRPPHELAYSWSGGGLADTDVSFRLEVIDVDRTRLHLAHEGFAGLLDRLIARDVLAAGWRGRLLARRLPALLDALAP